MTKLPILKPKEVVKKLEKVGFFVTRQTGSHARLIHPDGRATTVALHNRDLPKGKIRHFFDKVYMHSLLDNYRDVRIRRSPSVYHSYRASFVEAVAKK